MSSLVKMCAFPCALLALHAVCLGQQPVLVDKTAPGPSHDGTSWATAFLTVQEGIDDAASTFKTDVLIAHGRYSEDGTGTAVPIVMSNNVSIRGGYLGYNNGAPGSSESPTNPDGTFNFTVLDGKEGEAEHVITASSISQQTDIDGMMITGGAASGSGAAGRGGGIRSSHAEILVENVLITGNTAVEGGGASVGGDEEWECRNSRFEENIAELGAGVYLASAQVSQFANVVFKDNGRTNPNLSPLTVRGGAVYIDNEVNIRMSNCLMFFNRAQLEGGAIFADPIDGTGASEEWEFKHCTITSNAVVGDNGATPGAGIHITDGDGTLPDVEADLDNSIVWGNTILLGDPAGEDVSVEGNVVLQIRASNVGAEDGSLTLDGDCISADPIFKNAPAEDFRLKRTSPCVDFGNDALIGEDFCDLDGDTSQSDPLSLDLSNNAREIDIPLTGSTTEIVDMGAYETPEN